MSELIPEDKAHIDSLSYEDLLRGWRFAPPGDHRLQGAKGVYWSQRMSELRAAPGGHDMHVTASKRIGW